MDKVTQDRIKELLQKNEKVAIAVGKNPTVDDMAAALSLYLSLLQAGKQVSVASATSPLVEVSNLVGVDKVGTSLDGQGGDMIVSFPYNRQDEIQKVSYTLDGGYLNIVVKAGDSGLSFSEKDVKFTHGGQAPTLLFIIATPRLSDLGTLFNPEALKETTVVNIDNKQHNQGFGDVVLVSQEFSSVSEQIANILIALELPLDTDVAQNLFTGIAMATDNFQKPRTSYLAFEMAGFLMRKGARRIVGNQAQHSVQPQQRQPQEHSRDARSGFPRQPQQHSRDTRPGFGRQPVQPITQPVQPISQPQPQLHVQPLEDFSQQFPTQPETQPSQQASGFQPQKQPMQPQKPRQEEAKKGTPPPDWLMPKVYRGSTNI